MVARLLLLISMLLLLQIPHVWSQRKNTLEILRDNSIRQLSEYSFVVQDGKVIKTDSVLVVVRKYYNTGNEKQVELYDADGSLNTTYEYTYDKEDKRIIQRDVFIGTQRNYQLSTKLNYKNGRLKSSQNYRNRKKLKSGSTNSYKRKITETQLYNHHGIYAQILNKKDDSGQWIHSQLTYLGSHTLPNMFIYNQLLKTWVQLKSDYSISADQVQISPLSKGWQFILESNSQIELLGVDGFIPLVEGQILKIITHTDNQTLIVDKKQYIDEVFTHYVRYYYER